MNDGSPLFKARYRSTCPHCYEPSQPGDHIGYVEGDDKPSCAQCHGALNRWN